MELDKDLLDYCTEELNNGDPTPLFRYYASVYSNHIDPVYVRMMPPAKRNAVYAKMLDRLNPESFPKPPLTLRELGIVSLPEGALV